MSSLILVVLLAGAVLYLAGGLVYLYRYTQARRSRPSQPRAWEDLRKRFTWLSVVGVLLLAGFVFTAWWSVPGNNIPWVPSPFESSHISTAPQGGGMPWERPVVSGTVPMASQTTSSTSTTSTTSSTETTAPTATETTATMASETTSTESTAPTDSTASETTSTVETTTSASTSTSTTTSETTTTAAASAPAPAPAPGSWTVCAASFRKASMAQDYAGRLVKEGLPARVNQVDLGQRGVWHRVCVGTFPSLEQARRQYKNWEKQGLISDAFLLPLR